MKLPKLREVLEALRAVVLGPATAKFPTAPSPAPPGYRGRPTYHDDDCVGCGACFQTCPARAILMEDDLAASPPTRTFTVLYDHCIFCQTCERSCITEKGIVLETEYDMVADTRDTQRMQVQKELITCDVCGSLIGARDHLVWLYHRLGPLAFANPTVMLTSLRELRVVDEPPAAAPLREPGEVTRGDRMRVLCPKCRASVTVLV